MCTAWAVHSGRFFFQQLRRWYRTRRLVARRQAEAMIGENAYKDLLDTLLQDDGHLLDFRQSYELFRKWDLEYRFDKRSKSDVVMRALHHLKLQIIIHAITFIPRNKSKSLKRETDTC